MCTSTLRNLVFHLFVFLVVGVTRRSCRGLWDTFMYQAVIKSRARVPARDSFVARRISGPGLASNYFLQVIINAFILKSLKMHMFVQSFCFISFCKTHKSTNSNNQKVDYCIHIIVYTHKEGTNLLVYQHSFYFLPVDFRLPPGRMQLTLHCSIVGLVNE